LWTISVQPAPEEAEPKGDRSMRTQERIEREEVRERKRGGRGMGREGGAKLLPVFPHL